MFISGLAEPNLPQETLHQILGKMFEEVPNFLQTITPSDFYRLTQDLPQDAVTLRLLFNLDGIAKLFQQMSYLQILHLTNNVIAPGPLQHQIDILLKVQEHFRTWTVDTLKNHHSEIGNTSLQFERKKLLELEPSIPWELLQLFVELFKLPIEELLDFVQWFARVTHEQFVPLTQILTIEPFLVLEFKRRFAPLQPTSPTPAPATVVPPPTLDPLSPPDQHMAPMISDELFADLVASTVGTVSMFDLEDQLLGGPTSQPQQMQSAPTPIPTAAAGAIAIIPGYVVTTPKIYAYLLEIDIFVIVSLHCV